MNDNKPKNETDDEAWDRILKDPKHEEALNAIRDDLMEMLKEGTLIPQENDNKGKIEGTQSN